MSDWNVYGPLIPIVGMVALTAIACTIVAANAPDIAAWWAARHERKQPAVTETRPLPLGGLVIPLRPAAIDPDPALGCPFCSPPFSATADCSCATPCGDHQCGSRAWGAACNTEAWQR